MLGKVIKHDFKAMSKLFIPTYLVFGALVILDALMNLVNSQIPNHVKAYGIIPVFTTLTDVLMFIGMILIIAISPILSTVCFYRSVAGNEGYLTHTLPVKRSIIVTGKMITGFLYSCISLVFVFISSLIYLFICHHDTSMEIISSIKNFFLHELKLEDFPVSVIVGFIIIILALIVQQYANVATYYCCVAIGQTNNTHKIIMSIVTYIAYTTILQILSSVFSFVMTAVLSNTSDSLNEFMVRNPEGFFLGVSIFALCLNLLISVLFTFICTKILDKKLNLT